MKPSLNEIKKKTIFMVCIVAVLLALLVLRVAYWQIIRGDELSSKAKAQQQGSSIVTASRGDIYDRNGKVLAESATVNTLICCLLYTSPSPRDGLLSRMPSSA